MAYFQQYHPDKVAEVPAVLAKFEGKEKKLLRTVGKLYGASASDFFRSHGF